MVDGGARALRPISTRITGGKIHFALRDMNRPRASRLGGGGLLARLDNMAAAMKPSAKPNHATAIR